VAVSTERLDRSEEALDLKKAVWAGFIKSRFWRTARRIEPHAVVGKIVLLGTLLFFGMVCLQQRLPKMEYFIATLGPFGFWYVVQQNLGLLRRVWENPWGKLAYGLVASVTVTLCIVMTDREIRLLTQSHPSLFPSAQQTVTVLNIIVMIFVEVSLLLFLWFMFQFLKKYLKGAKEWLLLPLDILSRFRFREMLGLPSGPTFRSITSDLARLLAYFWGACFISLMPSFLDTGFAGVGGKPFNPTEVLLLWSSFIPNDLGLAGSDRVCINLPSDTLVYPFSTRDPIPDKVLMAQPISTGTDRLGRSYTYQVVACSKPIDPSALSSARSDISRDQKSGDTSTGSSQFAERPAKGSTVPKTQNAVSSRNRRLEN
jgi:hypothetical protein